MSRTSSARCLLTWIVLCALFPIFAPAVRTQPDATSADARLRALYTEEWKWRQQEMARSSDQPGDVGASDHFPKVDAASQQARLAYWTRALATFDSIPFDELSPEERVNAQIFRTSIREIATDVRFRTYEAPFNSDTFFWTAFTPRQGLRLSPPIAHIWGASGTCRLLR